MDWGWLTRQPHFFERMKSKKNLYRWISAVSLFVMAAAILSILYTFYLYRRSSQEYLSLSQSARLPAADRAPQKPDAPQEPDMPQEPDAPQTAGDTAPESAPPVSEADTAPGENETPILPMPRPEKDEPAPAQIPIDFEYLAAVNEDIMGWIEVEGTGIDYPILYDATPNRYYLNHSHTRAYTPYGSIFVLSDNERDYSDFNTVVYGHNMLDGSMFAPLHRFEDEDFFAQNHTIVVYTADRVLCYRIFAAYMTDNLDLLKNYDYSTPEARQAYIDRIYTHETRALFDLEVPVTPDDRILTLSTCIVNPAYRYLVQGVLASETVGVQMTSGEG